MSSDWITIDGVAGHKGPDLGGVGRRLKKDALRRQILNGGTTMPAFGDALSGDDVEALARYLERCRARNSAERTIGSAGAKAPSEK